MKYEVFNYMTGETVCFVSSEWKAKRLMRKYRRLTLDYTEVGRDAFGREDYDVWPLAS